MTLEIDTLYLDDFDINDIQLDDNIDEDYMNILYSYPYYSKDEYDYEFRISFEDNNLILDEVEYNENVEFDESTVIEKHILTKNINDIIHLLENNIDIRDEKTVLTHDILIMIDENNETFEEDLENNKKVVLKDLYTDILDSIL
mgnify:FL=1|tara:strand:- start:2035 stop:2466 length:432 start_codon:yes stop_codon:yes gene_type:complete